jgi:hypothetical protein
VLLEAELAEAAATARPVRSPEPIPALTS